MKAENHKESVCDLINISFSNLSWNISKSNRNSYKFTKEEKIIRARQSAKKYYKNNKEKISIKDKKYYKKNKKWYSEYQKKYYLENIIRIFHIILYNLLIV